MNLFKAKLDTRQQNGVIATVTQFDNAALELQIVTDGQVSEAWESPQFELIAMKRDNNPVRETAQDRFTILSKEDHKVQVELKEQFLTCRGTVKMQLVIKEGSRLSTTLFYLVIGQSLDHDIVESHHDVAVLDELETYIKQGFDDLAYQEQRMTAVEQSTNDLNDMMNANEAERNKAESVRQQTFDINEAHRARTFNNQVEEQGAAFSNAQAQREKEFSESQQNMLQEFEASQRERESAFDKSQKSNQQSFDYKMDEFEERFLEIKGDKGDTGEQGPQGPVGATGPQGPQGVQGEKGEQGEVGPQGPKGEKGDQGEVGPMGPQGEKGEKGDSGGVMPSDMVDYMGNQHESLKAKNDADVDWLLGEINTVHYEGQQITATDSIEGRSKSAILKGQTLVNLVPKKIIDHIASSDWDGYCCLVQNSKQSFDQWRALQDLKPNTKYYISCYVETFEDANNKDYCLNNPSVESIFEDSMIINGVGRYQWLSTTKSELTDEIFIVLRSQNAHARGAIKIRDIMIIEYQQGMENWDIPYFEGMQSVKFPVLSTTGKNLLDINKLADINNHTATLTTATYTIAYPLQLKPNTTYSISRETSDKLSVNLSVITIIDGSENRVSITGTANKARIATTGNDGVLYLALQNVDESKLATIINDVGYLQVEEGSVATSYEPYQSNILTVNEDVTLRSNGDICDELNLLTGQLTQRIGEDGVVLSQEVVKTVDLSDNHVYSYKGTTHYDCSSAEGSLVPTLSIDVPTNLPAVVTRQRVTIQELEKENVALKNEIEETANSSVNGDLELMSSQFELDFRLFEIEMNLDMPMMAMMRGVKSMAMTVYQQAKTLILAGKYEREDMEYKLNRYKAAGRIAVEEYEELIALMDARELVD